MYDVHGVCTPSRCVSALIHEWLVSRGQPRLATNFLTGSCFAAADGWTRLPRKVTRWSPRNVRSRTLTDAYRRLRALIPSAGLLLLPRVTVSNRTPVWLGLNVPLCHVPLGTGISIFQFPSPLGAWCLVLFHEPISRCLFHAWLAVAVDQPLFAVVKSTQSQRLEIYDENQL